MTDAILVATLALILTIGGPPLLTLMRMRAAELAQYAGPVLVMVVVLVPLIILLVRFGGES